MRKKMFFTLMVSFFAAFCLVGTAMAANTITIKSDKPIIPKSDCGHAGSLTAQFDNGTVLHQGDVIRFKLDDNSSVCGDINYFLRLTDKGTFTTSPASGDPVQTSDGSTYTIQSFLGDAQANPAGGISSPIKLTTGSATVNGSTVAVGFLVTATDGSQYVTLTLAMQILDPGDTNLNVVTDPTCKLNIKITTGTTATMDLHLFDGNVNNAYFYVREDATNHPTRYNLHNLDKNDPTDVAKNTFCINTTDFTSTLDHAIPESRPFNNNSSYQQSFLGDYIIAQLVAAVDYKVTTACKDDICNPVPIGTTVDQQGVETTPDGKFSFGLYNSGPKSASSASTLGDRWGSSGYCAGYTNTGNAILIYKDGDSFSAGDQYKVTLTVRDGSTANDKVAKWRTGAVDWFSNSNSGSNCSFNAAPFTNEQYAGGGYTDVKAGDDSAIEKTYTITASQDSNNAIVIQLPQVQLPDLEKVSAGDKVYVDVEVTKLPCGGAIKKETFCLAELVDKCTAPTNVSIDGIAFIGDRQLTRVLHGYLGRLYTKDKDNYNKVTYKVDAMDGLFFPYAPALNDADFFTGLVIDNTGTSDVVLTVTLQDSAGGTATYTSGTVKAGTQWVDVLDNLKSSLVEGATPLDLTKTVTVSVVAGAVQ